MPAADRLPLPLRIVGRVLVCAALGLPYALAEPPPAERPPAQRPPAESQTREVPPLHVEGLVYVLGEEGGDQLVLRATRGSYVPRRKRAVLEEVQIEISEEPGEAPLRVAAPRAHLDLASRAFRAEGGVLGRSDDGQWFETEWLRYEPDARLLHSDAPVTVWDGEGRMTGGGLRYYLDPRRLEVVSGVRVAEGR